jgi:hypothetical protein
VGKWSNLKGKLPAHPGESPEWMDRVRAEKDRILREEVENPNSATAIGQLTELYNEARKAKDDFEDQIKTLNITIEALQQLIVTKLEESGSDIWRGNGYSFSEKPEPYASIENKSETLQHFLPISEAIDLIRKTGELRSHEDVDEYLTSALMVLERARQNLGMMQIPWQTLNSLVKAEAEAGELLIEGDGEKVEARSSIPGVKVFLKSSINRRKAGEK